MLKAQTREKLMVKASAVVILLTAVVVMGKVLVPMTTKVIKKNRTTKVIKKNRIKLKRLSKLRS